MNLFEGAITHTEFTDLIKKHLGYSGRMLSYSKSGYRESHPNGRPYFNACIYDQHGIQVWYGDIDISLDKKKLQKLVQDANRTFYVTPEHPYRSDFNNPKIEDLEKDEYVIKFKPRKRKQQSDESVKQ